jgi:hypothetical protein
MAVKSFWIPLHPKTHDYLNNFTQDLENFTGEQWWSPINCRSSHVLRFQITSKLPVEASSREISANKLQSFFDDYYNRIHITPSILELGNVASEQVSRVDIWNAYLVPKVLQSIDGLQEGISVSGQDHPPVGFTALQERSWNVSILPDGPSTIDANVIWQFGTDQAQLHITGTRIVAFGWLVDWSKPISESLQWLTDILQSQTGYEQRRSLRLTPRISYEADLLIYDTERQYFELAMIGWGAKTFALPIWNQQQWLKTAHSIGGLIVYCDTTHRNFRANRLAILRGQNAFDNETIEIESVLADRLILKRPLQKNWSKGTCLSPAVTAQMTSQPNLIKRTDRMMRTSVAFTVTEAVDHPKSLPTTIYRNSPVLEEKPNEQNDFTHSYERLLAQLDNKTGFSLQKDLAQAAFSLYQYDWMTYGRVQQANLRALFYALRGSQKSIWLPTFSNDLTVKAVITANSQMIDIQWCGYTRFAQKQLGRQDIQIILRNKTVLYRRITSATEINNTTERLGVDQAFSNQINVKDILNISFISLCRLSNDTLTFEHINDSDGIAKASVTWRGVRET